MPGARWQAAVWPSPTRARRRWKPQRPRNFSPARRRAQSRSPRLGRVQEGHGARARRSRAADGVRARGEGLAMAMHKISVTVNGAAREAAVESRLLLVHLLREVFRMTGTHVGCDTSHCGACTVILDGNPVKSCTLLAVKADGAKITTVEGLEQGGKLHPVQEGFTEKHGLQCGFCTPGMMLSSVALLERNKNPSAQEIREAIAR